MATTTPPASAVKISRFKLISIAWSVYKKLSAWWKESSVDGVIDVDEFSNLWEVFAEIYEDLSGKKLQVTIPKVKTLKPVDGRIRKNITIKEEQRPDEKPGTDYDLGDDVYDETPPM